jgi:sugar lactone lactonase YvrE/uncharacterized protein YegL
MHAPRRLAVVLLVAGVALAMGARALLAQPAASALAYAFAATFGTSDTPWQRSNAFLNQPWGLGADRDGVWVANAAGRNLVRFGAGAVEDLGRAGDLDALYGAPLRSLADVAVVGGAAAGGGGGGGGIPTLTPTPTPTKRIGPRPLQRATPTPIGGSTGSPDRMVWVVDPVGHVAVGIPLAPDGRTGTLQVLGETDVSGSDDAHFSAPGGIAADTAGLVYVSDTDNHRVQIFDADGLRLATIGQSGVAGLAAGQLNHPARLALSTDGRLFIADSGNHRVVAYDVRNPAAPVEVASYGQAGAAGNGNDQFRAPMGVAVDATFLYVADSGNGRVQLIQRSDGKYWRTLDGATPATCGGVGGAWDYPTDVALDQSGNVYVALPRRMLVVGCDGASRLARADLSHGGVDAPYLTKPGLYNAPVGVAVASDGAIAVVEGEGQRVLRLRADGSEDWVTGKAGLAGLDVGGALRFNGPTDAGFLPDGRLVVSDTGNGRLVVLNADGSLDATWGLGQLQSPAGLAVLADGSLAVADSAAGRVRRLSVGGAVTGDLAGPGGPLNFAAPADVAVDAAGNWYVSEPAAHVVRVLDAAGRPVRTLGEVGVPGSDFAHLRRPTGLAVDAAGRLLVVDTGNNRLQVFAADGSFLTTVGGRRGGGSGGMVEPRGVGLGPDGRVVVADTYNHRLQAFDLATEPWLPANVNGFGNRAAPAVEALAEFDGRLYAGLRAQDGAAIWRRDGLGPWQSAMPDGFGAAANQGLTALTVYGDRLYAGVENLTEAKDPATGQLIESSTGGGIWRSADGTRWDAVAERGLGDAKQSGFGPFAAFRGQLFAGTRSIDPAAPPQLWATASGDAGSWHQVRIDLFSRGEWPKNGAISAMAAYSSSLYVGTCAQDKAQVWQSSDGATWRPAGQLEPGADPRDALAQLGPTTPCITSFAEYDGHLVAGLGTDLRMARRLGRGGGAPVELWRCVKCDGTDWDTAAGGGFGNNQNRGAVALIPFDEPPFRYLYAFAGNSRTGLEVWRAPDGLDWDGVAGGGFGDDNNSDAGSGAAVAVYQGRLFAGTVNGVQGGELWSSAGTRPGIVPTPPGPSPTPTPRPSPQPPVGRARYHKVDEWPVNEPAPADVLGAPVDMAVAADGEVYLLDGGPVRIERLLPGGTWGSPFGATGSGPDRITMAGALAVDDAAGRVYVSDLGTERLVAFDRSGRYVAQLARDTYAVDVAVRPDGTIWLADQLSGGIRRLAADGSELERFGQYGPQDEDGFQGMVAVAEEPAGRLWVADQGGMRLRAYRRQAGGALTRERTVDLTAAAFTFNGCTGVRLQALRDNVLLAGPCILEDGRFLDGLPLNHRSSDLYNVGLRTANPAAGKYFALAAQDLDRNDPVNETFPAVVQYQDEGFDIVTGYWLGRTFSPTTAADNAVVDPVRIDALAGGELSLTDARAFTFPPPPPAFIRRMSPTGAALEKLGLVSFPSRHYSLLSYGNFAVSTGEPGRVIGLARLRQGRGTNFEVLAYSQTVRRRYCTNGLCNWGMYSEPIWQTSLVNLNLARGANDYNYAATFDAVRKQYVLLQLWADNPLDVAMPARLYLFPVEQRGRKTEVALDGTERQSLWTDVDAGPDGRLYVLDTLNDRVQVLDGAGNRLGMVDTPKDAWKVAGGPNGEIFVLTNYGHVVRMAADGTVLSRFLGLPNDFTPPTALADLAVDAWGRVYTIDNLYDLVTVFEPEGTEDDVLQGNRCSLGGDKWVAPDEIKLGDTAELFLTLFGTCGFVEDRADIVLALTTPIGQETANLRVARQIFSVVDLDRHRVGIVSYVTGAKTEQKLTNNRQDLIRSLYDLTGSRPTCNGPNNESALREARKVFADSPPGKRKVLVLINPGDEPEPGVCAWSVDSIARTAAELKAEGVVILAVNQPSIAASSEVLSNIPVAQRGQGVGRPAIRRALSRTWPANLVKSGTLVDKLPANIDYVPGSAKPAAAWDAAARTLTWTLTGLALGEVPRFGLTIRPRAEGLWPTNVEALADVVDGWGNAQQLRLPVPKIRVYGELPPTPTFTPTRTPTPTVTLTPEPTSTPRPTKVPVPIYLPILLKTADCKPGSRNADVALVIDTSGSMSETTSPGGPTKLVAAQDAARAFLGQLQAGRDQVALVQFNTTATVVEPLTGNIAAVTAAVSRLTQAPGTRIDLALDLATAELVGPGRLPGNNPVIILLTDGEPTGATPDDVRQAANRARAAGMLVFTIGLGQAVDQQLMRDVATIPEWYFFAPDTSDLAGIYGQIAYAIPCKPEWP